ncbi:MAG: thermostable hemolysin [Halioglobus sp.]
MGENVALPAAGQQSMAANTLMTGQVVVGACDKGSPEREALEQFISSIFSASYGAKILEYLPLLFSLMDGKHHTAALGVGSAAAAPLFCEQYLDTAVEDQVMTLYSQRVGRRDIMELGNLVSTTSGQSALLYLLVAAALDEACVGYLLFAANRAVRASIRRSGFTPKIIHVADSRRLGVEAANWGSYYEGEPIVMLADIALTIEQARCQPVMCKLLDSYSHAIPVLADAIRKLRP